MPINQESELLLPCLRLGEHPDDAARVANYSPAEWEIVLQGAKRHGIVPLLAWRLKASASAVEIPQEIRQELQQGLLLSAAKNLRLFHELGMVLGKFQASGIPVVVLKGAFLAAQVYPDIALRPMGDIDLLVKEEQLPQANECLISMGYQPVRYVRTEKEIRQLHHLPPYTKPEAATIELHWNIAPPSLFPFRIDPASLWSRAQPVTVAEQKALALSPEDLLLHLCQHICQHSFRTGLRHLYDIAETLNYYHGKMDWTQVIARAGEWQVCKCLFITLDMANELLNAPVPPLALDKLQPDDLNPEIEGVARERLQKPDRSEMVHPDLVRLWGDQSFKAKILSLFHTLFPFPEYIVQKYSLSPGSKKVYLYYMVRLWDLSLQYGRQLWRLIRREKTTISFSSQENALDDWLKS